MIQGSRRYASIEMLELQLNSARNSLQTNLQGEDVNTSSMHRCITNTTGHRDRHSLYLAVVAVDQTPKVP